MRHNKLDQLTQQMENYLECWKQFNQFVSLARTKKFSTEDENQFLEIKSVLVQELELILASIEVTNPTRQEVHDLVGNAPSLRYLPFDVLRGGYHPGLSRFVQQQFGAGIQAH